MRVVRGLGSERGRGGAGRGVIQVRKKLIDCQVEVWGRGGRSCKGRGLEVGVRPLTYRHHNDNNDLKLSRNAASIPAIPPACPNAHFFFYFFRHFFFYFPIYFFPTFIFSFFSTTFSSLFFFNYNCFIYRFRLLPILT